MPLSDLQADLTTALGAGATGGAGAPRFVATPAGDSFGDVGAYSPCACCGRFHAVFEDGGTGPLGLLNGDDRGVLGPNGKTSLSTTDAGSTITRSNVAWGTLGQAANINFAFRSTAPTTMPDDTTGFTRFSEAQIAATLQALASWSDVANITFTRAQDADGYSDSAVMLFGNYSSGSDGAAAFAYLPANRAVTSSSGDVWINASLSYNSTPVMLGYGQQVLTHEIGHAIGLSHPAAYNAGAGVSISYSAFATYFEDSRQYTVMSYFNESNTGASFGSGRYAAAPLMDDIAAAQRLYGVNTTTRTGNTTYGFNSNAGQVWFSAASSTTALIFCAWDAGGSDTFDFSGYLNSQIIDLRQGAFSNVGGLIGNVSIAMGASIEAAIGGSGSDTLIGSSGDNVLTGGAGNDTLDGGLGSDTAVFSGNRSAYTISWNGRVGTVTGADGTDTLVNVEFLRFADQTIAAAPTGGIEVAGDVLNNILVGTNFADTLTGGGGNDQIDGGAGDDFLGGGSGDDSIIGGEGNDYFYGDAGNDVLTGGNGIDMIDYSGSRTTPGSVALAAGVTVDLSAGRATGGGGNDTLNGFENIIGTRFNDILRGTAGDNSISGFAGSDIIYGGDGNDQIFGGAGAESGGAPDIVKARSTVNNSTGTAVVLDGGFDLLARPDVANASTLPHATVVATTHGGIEYYAVTVAAGAQIVLDIDNGSFDTTLRLLGPDGVQVAANDDSAADGGPATDSQLTFTATRAGVYYIAVGQYDAGGVSDFTSKAPAAGGTYTLHVSVANHAVVATTFVGSQLYGEAGNDTLTGGSSADLLVGGAGSDTIIGGGGVDTSVYSGNSRSYSTVSSTRVVGGAEGGTDTISGVEVLRFLDGRVSYDASDISTVVYRLYDAAFDRGPDVFGLADYSRAILEGRATVQSILDVFAGSPEFRARYGALSNDAFVREMYRFSLNREGDAVGVAQYVNALNAGTVTRAQVLGIFSESQEHQALVANVITSQGLFVQDEATIAIARLYDSVFNRLPDLAGLQSYRAAVDQGFTLKDIGAVLVGSPEFQQRFGALSNQQFVEQIYRFVLDRAGDAAGIASYVQALSNGYTRADVVLVLSESPEHRGSYQATYDGQVRNLGVGGASPLEDVDAKPDAGQDALVIPAIADAAAKFDPAHDAFVLPAVSDAEAASVSSAGQDGALVHAAGLDGLDLGLDDGGAQVIPALSWIDDLRVWDGPDALSPLDAGFQHTPPHPDHLFA